MRCDASCQKVCRWGFEPSSGDLSKRNCTSSQATPWCASEKKQLKRSSFEVGRKSQEHDEELCTISAVGASSNWTSACRPACFSKVAILWTKPKALKTRCSTSSVMGTSGCIVNKTAITHQSWATLSRQIQLQ